ncbi:tRNA-queuosine alpha-mannosyltransferase domain-containing protein [Desulfolithobacter sp.]
MNEEKIVLNNMKGKRAARICVLEPYYGGSHRAFLQGLFQHVAMDFTLVSLPARKWKMRMQLAAPWMARQVKDMYARGVRFDGLLVSTFLDLSVLQALLGREGIHLPAALYFHENQFVYPGQVEDPQRFQFTAINFTSALAADTLAFNSSYNRDTFIEGVRFFLKKATDIRVVDLADQILAKSRVLAPGIDFRPMDRAEEPKHRADLPVVVWNHRWEHDKDPEFFFHALKRVAAGGVDFRILVLGECFRNRPAIFSRVEKMFQHQLLHFGYAPDRETYAALLGRGDIVVSTARHEFFGIAVLEAVRAGCWPLVPDRLAYVENFPDRYRYRDASFVTRLRELIRTRPAMSRKERLDLTERFSWARLGPRFHDWLLNMLSKPA